MIVNAAQFAAALAAIKPAVATRCTLPVLETVLLQRTVEGLRLAATDLELRLQTTIPVMIETDDSSDELATCLNYKDLVKIIDAKGEAVEIVQAENHAAQIKQGPASVTMKGITPEDHPMHNYQWHQGDDSFGMNADELTILKDAVLPAAAKDDSRPVLAGVQFQERDGKAYATAADGFVMADACIGSVTPPFESFIVPAKALRSLLSAAKGMRFYVGGFVFPISYRAQKYRHDIFVQGSIRTIDGTFPDLAQIIPADEALTTAVSIETGVIDAAAKIKTPHDVFKVCEDHAGVMSDGQEMAWNGSSVRWEGTPAEFALNVKYAQWASKATAQDGRVTFHGQSSNAAWMARDEHSKLVIMPMVIGAA